MLKTPTLSFIVNYTNEAIKQRFSNVEQNKSAHETHQLVGELKQLNKQLKTIKEDKNRLTSQFKDNGLSESQKRHLKEQVRRISGELKPIEKLKKENENKLLRLFEVDSIVNLPKRFTYQPEHPISEKYNVGLEENPAIPEWNNYVQNNPCSNLYHSYEWPQLIHACFGHKCYSFIARNSHQKIVGILTITHVQSRLFGNYAVSLPYFNYGGPLADSQEIENALMEHSAKYLTDNKLSHIEYRLTKKLENWPVQENKTSMVLALPKTQQELDKQLGSKIRAQIKQATKHNIQMKAGRSNLLEDFYQVFAENMRDLGTPVYSKDFFKSILSVFPNITQIIVLYKGGIPISAGFLLGYRDMLEIPWASTLRRANSINANMLLYREILGYAIDQDYSYFDFGRSSKNSGTYQFKKQWGAKPVQHYWHYWLPKGESLPALNPDNPKFKLAINIWRRLPVWLTKMIGPLIVKDLP